MCAVLAVATASTPFAHRLEFNPTTLVVYVNSLTNAHGSLTNAHGRSRVGLVG